MDIYHGIPYSGIVPVLVRSTAPGVVSVSVNGSFFTAIADPAVDDGLALVNVTGLSPGAKYSATVITPNESDTITLRTFPEKGEVKVGFHSCGISVHKPALGNYVAQDVDCVLQIGDEFYPEVQYSAFGITTPSVKDDIATATDLSVYRQKHIQSRRTPEWKAMLTSRGCARIPDDHDFAINDLTFDLPTAQLAMPFLSTLDDLRAVIDAAGTAVHEYDQINPPNIDSPVDVNPIYTRFTVGEHLEIFLLSSVRAGHDLSAADRLVRPNTGDMLTQLEEAWLLDRLRKSDRAFKCVVSPKMTLISTFHQDDFSENGRDAQRDRILQSIHDDSPSWLVPGGCFWVSGDFHTPSVHASYAGVNGDTYDHLNVTACPAGSNTTNSGSESKHTRKSINVGDSSGYPPQNKFLAAHKNVGVITIPAGGEYAKVEILLSSGAVWWRGYVKRGENKLSYMGTNLSL